MAVMWLEAVLLVIVVGITGNDGGFGDIELAKPISIGCSPTLCDADGVPLITGQTRQDCCHKCSCDPETCGRHRTCCHDYLDKYNVTKDMLCYETGLFNVYMVYTCEITDSRTPGIGLIRPVLSESTRRVYVNMEIAKCNNVMDYVEWNLQIICYDMDSVLHHISGVNKHCSEHVVPPHGTLSWLKYFICEDSLVSDCGNFSDYQPTHEELAGCANIRDPYFINSRGFQNGHCAACRRDTPLSETMKGGECGSQDYIPFFTTYFSVITTEIDLMSYQTILNEDTSHSCDKHYTGNPNKAGCRRILCPEGMLRVDEKCEYVLKDMYRVQSALRIRLYSPKTDDGNTLTMEDLDRLRVFERQDPHTIVSTSCRLISHFDIFSSELTLSNGETVIDHILIYGQMHLAQTTLEYLVNETHNCATSRWVFTIFNQEFVLISKLDDTIGPVDFDGIHQAKKTLSDDMNTSQNKTNRAVYKAVSGPLYMEYLTGNEFSESVYETPNFHITKLHLCEQVVMHPDEVEIRYQSNQVVLKHNGEVLEDGEFMILYAGEGEISTPFRIKVCVEKFRSRQLASYTSTGTTTRWSVHVYYIMIMISVMM